MYASDVLAMSKNNLFPTHQSSPRSDSSANHIVLNRAAKPKHSLCWQRLRQRCHMSVGERLAARKIGLSKNEQANKVSRESRNEHYRICRRTEEQTAFCTRGKTTFTQHTTWPACIECLFRNDIVWRLDQTH